MGVQGALPPAGGRGVPEKSTFHHPLLRPSLLVAVTYIVLIILITLIHHYNVIHYIHIGTKFSQHDPKGFGGYDGQFYYQLARDPFHAYQFMDDPPYRYQRIIYPLVVRLLSLGQTALIPYMLLLVNCLSSVLSVEIVARLLKKHGMSPWFSLALGFYFGQTSAFIFDTTEPFTYLLVCLGLLLIEEEYLTAATISMGLAVLSRETAILFPIGYTVFYLLRGRWKDMARFVILALLPLPIWYAVLWKIFGSTGLTYAPPFEHIPFGGLFTFLYNPTLFWSLIGLMFVPTIGGCIFAASEILKRHWNKAYLLLIWLLHLVLVTFMAQSSYQEFVSAGRISSGIVLATLLYGWQTRNKTLLWISQYYTLTFAFYAFGVLFTRFVPT